MNKKFLKWSVFIIIHLFFCISLCDAYSGTNLTQNDFTKINQSIQDTFFLKKRLQKSVQKERVPHLKCGTSLMRLAKRFPEKLWPENRFILYRPDDENNDYYPYDENITQLFHYDSLHFRFHYAEESSYNKGSDDCIIDTDGDPNTIPPYILEFKDYFEHAWDTIVGLGVSGYGYMPPSPDEGKGGNDKVDVYFMNIDCYGLSTYDFDGHVYIIMRNTYENDRENLDPDGSAKGLMKVTAAHEFFHVVQNEYDHWTEDIVDNLWWEETTAVWMEDEVYDEVNDYLYYLGWPYDDTNKNGIWDSGEQYYNITGAYQHFGRERGWFDRPFKPLDFVGFGSDLYEYGNVIWGKFLAESLGVDFIKNVFLYLDTQYKLNLEDKLIDQSTLKAITAIEQSLFVNEINDMSLADALCEFRIRNITGEYEECQVEGLNYPQVAYSAQFDEQNYNNEARFISFADSDIHNDLERLASHYLSIKPDAGYFSAPISISITPQSDNASWEDMSVVIIGVDDDDNFYALDNKSILKGDSANTKTWVLDSSYYQNYSQVLATLVNISMDKTVEYSISYSIGDAPLTPAIKFPYFDDSIVADEIRLVVYNSYNFNYESLNYEFELYDREDLSIEEPIYTMDIDQGEGGETVWEIGKIAYNTDEIPNYFWRCRTRDNSDNYSPWTNLIRFKYQEPFKSLDDEPISCFVNMVR